MIPVAILVILCGYLAAIDGATWLVPTTIWSLALIAQAIAAIRGRS